MPVSDYFVLLSRAVAGLDCDSYAARGAIYDRERKILLRRLFLDYPPHSDAEIEEQQRAFREAVRRVEFGATVLSDEETQVSLVPQSEPLPELTEAVAKAAAHGDFSRHASSTPQREKSSGDEPRWPRLLAVLEDTRNREHAAADVSGTPQAAGLSEQKNNIAPNAALLKRRPITGRVLRRALAGLVLLGIGATAYGILSGELKFPSLRPIKRRSAWAREQTVRVTDRDRSDRRPTGDSFRR
jgi:hypothetical protein